MWKPVLVVWDFVWKNVKICLEAKFLLSETILKVWKSVLRVYKPAFRVKFWFESVSLSQVSALRDNFEKFPSLFRRNVFWECRMCVLRQWNVCYDNVECVFWQCDWKSTDPTVSVCWKGCFGWFWTSMPTQFDAWTHVWTLSLKTFLSDDIYLVKWHYSLALYACCCWGPLYSFFKYKEMTETRTFFSGHSDKGCSEGH